jgi:uncharacterized protein (DUF2147 family)
MIRSIIALAIGAASLSAFAQTSPVGLWKQVDEDGKTEKSYIRIAESSGKFSAKIEKIIDPAKQEAKCDLCTDERKGQPILGMSILRNLSKSSSDDNTWDGGEILKPDEGKTYKVRLRPIDDGKKLEVRGYIGMPMLGKTQIWQRIE